MSGRDGVTAFLPLDSKIGGQSRGDYPPMVGQYKKVETGANN